MFGYYTTALTAVFLLLQDPRAVASAQDPTGFPVKTTKSLRDLTECGREEQLQIVDAVFDQQKKSLPISDLIAIYNAADELVDIGGRQGAIERAKDKLRQIEDGLGDSITVRYFCVSRNVDAANLCRRSGNMEWTRKRSVTFLNEAVPACSRHCRLKPSRPPGTHYFFWNVLVNQPQSSSFKAMYSTDGGNDWQCLDLGFQSLSTSEAMLHFQFSWKDTLSLTRLWFSFGGAPFEIACQDVNDRIVPKCSRKSTMSVATTTTSKSGAATPVSPSGAATPVSPSGAATPVSPNTISTPTAQSDDPKQMVIVKVVLSAAGVVTVFILVAVVYRVKKRSQNPVRRTNPGTTQSAAVTRV